MFDQVLDTLGLEGIKDKPYCSFMHYAVSASNFYVGYIMLGLIGF